MSEEILSPEVTESIPAPKKKSKKKLWIGLGVGVGSAFLLSTIAAITIVVVLIMSFFNTPQSVANAYMDAVLEADMAACLDILPDAVKDFHYSSEKEAEQWVRMENRTLQTAYEILDRAYDEWEITYRIVSVENVDDDVLDNLEDRYDWRYDCKIQAAKEIEIRATLTADGKESSETFSIYVVKIGTKWYLDNEFSTFFTDSTFWHLIF